MKWELQGIPRRRVKKLRPSQPELASHQLFPPSDDRRRLSKAWRRCAGGCSRVCQRTMSQRQKKRRRLDFHVCSGRRHLRRHLRRDQRSRFLPAESCSSQFTFALTWDGCGRGHDYDQTPTLPVPPSFNLLCTFNICRLYFEAF